MKFSRTWAMPNSSTFDVLPIRNFVRKYIYGTAVDPFARNSGLANYTNDINPETKAKYHMDAEDFLRQLHKDGVVANTIILDPPYSPRQISECYKSVGREVGMKDTQNAALYSRVRNAARLLCRADTTVLSFGWNSAGMGQGFEIIEIMLVAHGGAHNDTICMAERCVQPELC